MPGDIKVYKAARPPAWQHVISSASGTGVAETIVVDGSTFANRTSVTVILSSTLKRLHRLLDSAVDGTIHTVMPTTLNLTSKVRQLLQPIYSCLSHHRGEVEASETLVNMLYSRPQWGGLSFPAYLQAWEMHSQS